MSIETLQASRLKISSEENTYLTPSQEWANIIPLADVSDELISGVYISNTTPQIIINPPQTPELATRKAISVETQKTISGKAKVGQEWFWTEEWQAAERQVEEDLAAGLYETFDSMEDFLADLE